MIRVLLVDDQKMVRETLKISLATESDIEIVGTASNGLAAIEQVETLQPDIVIMNMEMPGLDGASATKQITSRFVETKVLIHTSYDRDEYITKTLAMGAKGYLLKNMETEDLAGIIRNINKGYTQISPGLLEKLLISTDSGVIISKLETPVYTASEISNVTNDTAISVKSQKSISNLKLISRQQQDEIEKLRHTIDLNQQQLPQIKKNLSVYHKALWFVSLIGLGALTLLGLSLFRLHNQTSTLQSETSQLKSTTNDLKLNVIPAERVGVGGEFSLSGIAQRVQKAYEQDPELSQISTLYVAQEDDAIVLFGTIPDAALLRRMENVAMEVEGVKRVYTSQVAIQSESTGQVLGAES